MYKKTKQVVLYFVILMGVILFFAVIALFKHLRINFITDMF